MNLSVQKVREQDATVDFKATLVSSDFEQELDNWFSKKSQSVRIDGFRPGKVPLSVVKTRFVDDATNSVVNVLIDRILKVIGKEHQIRVAGQPQVTIEKADTKEGFECKIVVECLPTFELQDFSKIACEELVLELSSKEVDEYLNNLLERHKGYEVDAKKDKATWGDKVHISVQLKDDSERLEKQELELDEKNNEEPVKQILKAVQGHKAGEHVAIELAYPKDFATASLAGKKVSIIINIESVHAPIKFKLDDVFAKQFECENLAALRAKVLEVHENDQKKLLHLYHKRQILDGLNNQYKLALPKSAVDFEFKQIWQRLQKEIADSKQRGDYEDDINLAEVETEYRGIAERRVKLGLLVSEIAKVHKIELTNDDLKNAILSEAMRHPDHSKEIIAYYSKNSDALQSLSAPLMEDKVVNFVFEKSKKKQIKVTTKDLSAKLKGVLPGFDDEDKAASKKTPKRAAQADSSEVEVAPAKKATKKKGE